MTEKEEINKIKKLLKIKPLKVWAGGLFSSGHTRRFIIAASDQKEAFKMVKAYLDSINSGNISFSGFRVTWKKTNNIFELKIAQEAGIWVNLDSSNGIINYTGRYKKIA